MKKEKPAENAEVFMMAVDRRIYDDLIKITKLLKESFCGRWISRSHCNALDSAAKHAYEKAEEEARLFWGYYEVRAVREKTREGNEGSVGNFDMWYLYHSFHYGSN